MSDVMKELSKPLENEDIEFRIQSVQKGKTPKGFSLLAYKTARTDVKRLNDTLGLNWKNKYFYDTKGILCCEISVYNETTKEWISRVDVGTESNTEKEKGNYSDAFKRSGFKWGIGLELYKFPFLWINWNDWNDWQGKITPKNFDNKKIEISNYVIEKGEVKSLTLTHKGNVIFKLGQAVKAKEAPKTPEVELITQEQVLEIVKLISEAKTTMNALLTNLNWGITKLEQIQVGSFDIVVKTLKDKIARDTKEEK